MSKEIEVKVGQQFELSEKQDMWKDDLSGVFLRAPGKIKLSRPKDIDFRSHLEWFQTNRLSKNIDDKLFKEDEGNTWFEITKDMNTKNIKKALIKGTLVEKGTVKRQPVTEPKSLFKTDKVTGFRSYQGPNRNIYSLLQKNNEKELIHTIEKIQDPGILEVMLDMEQKGWNPTASPRKHIIEIIEKQVKNNAQGLSRITEDDLKIETVKKKG